MEPVEIKLNNGGVTLIDAEDFERVNTRKWRLLQTTKARRYATTHGRVGEAKKLIYLHRFILGEHHKEIDHIDGDGLNNQKSNLRPCNRSLNNANRKVKGNAKYKGVETLSPTCHVAYYRDDMGKKHLGCFKTDWEAAQAYNKAAYAKYGAFALLNKRLS